MTYVVVSGLKHFWDIHTENESQPQHNLAHVRPQAWSARHVPWFKAEKTQAFVHPVSSGIHPIHHFVSSGMW